MNKLHSCSKEAKQILTDKKAKKIYGHLLIFQALQEKISIIWARQKKGDIQAREFILLLTHDKATNEGGLAFCIIYFCFSLLNCKLLRM